MLGYIRRELRARARRFAAQTRLTLTTVKIDEDVPKPPRSRKTISQSCLPSKFGRDFSSPKPLSLPPHCLPLPPGRSTPPAPCSARRISLGQAPFCRPPPIATERERHPHEAGSPKQFAVGRTTCLLSQLSTAPSSKHTLGVDDTGMPCSAA